MAKNISELVILEDGKNPTDPNNVYVFNVNGSEVKYEQKGISSGFMRMVKEYLQKMYLPAFKE